MTILRTVKALLRIPKFKKYKSTTELRKILALAAKNFFWFILGAVLGLFFFASFLYVSYRNSYKNYVYSGVMVNGIEFGGKKESEVKEYFDRKNSKIRRTKFILESPEAKVAFTGKDIDLGYDSNLLSHQAFSIGRSSNLISNLSILLQAYTETIKLPAAFNYSEEKLNKYISPLKDSMEIKPVEALFNFENGKVVAFRPSVDGKTVDLKKLKQDIFSKSLDVALSDSQQTVTMKIPTITLRPSITTDKVNNLGIKEFLAEGTSLFYHSIENRIYNIGLAATRLNGILVPPGKVFSFTQTLGDVSSFTGFKQAYVIENGKTVLGDGGGVCQVSTTLFRAALNAGLPIIERNPHAYRVGYYEQDSGPGIDAAIYSPSVDLKFKNDTNHHILIQSYVDYNQQKLVFDLYGTRDDRQVEISQPVILSESPAPAPLYQDDPTLPKGEIKQIDFAATGANVYFTRTVKKNGKVVISDKFISNYRPWQAIFLKGTK